MFITIIHNFQKVGKPNCPLTWMHKKKWSLYNGRLLSHNKEWSSGTSYNMDGPWRRNPAWNKPDTKDHMLYHSIYVSCPD